MTDEEKWIGVDLDGTLAYYDGWRGIEHIGEPIPLMMERVSRWISEGKRVKIFTARVCERDEMERKRARIYVQAWCVKHGLGCLEVTNVKDFDMVELWDDRCVAVETNTGQAKNNGGGL